MRGKLDGFWGILGGLEIDLLRLFLVEEFVGICPPVIIFEKIIEMVIIKRITIIPCSTVVIFVVLDEAKDNSVRK